MGSSISKLKTGRISPRSIVNEMGRPIFVLSINIVQRLLIFVSIILTNMVDQIKPNEKTMSELKKMPKHQQDISMPITRVNNGPEIVVLPRQVEIGGNHRHQINRPVVGRTNTNDIDMLHAKLLQKTDVEVNHVTSIHQQRDFQILHERLAAVNHIENNVSVESSDDDEEDEEDGEEIE